MALKETPRALILVLDSEGKVSNYELEVFVTYEAEGPDDPMARAFSPSVVRKELTPTEAATYIGESAGKQAAENRALHEQIVGLQKQIVDKGTELESAVSAMSQQIEQHRLDSLAMEQEMNTAKSKLLSVQKLLSGE